MTASKNKVTVPSFKRLWDFHLKSARGLGGATAGHFVKTVPAKGKAPSLSPFVSQGSLKGERKLRIEMGRMSRIFDTSSAFAHAWSIQRRFKQHSHPYEMTYQQDDTSCSLMPSESGW